MELNTDEARFIEKEGNSVIEGTLVWTSPDSVPGIGIGKAEWTFTPTGKKYASCKGELTVVVEAADVKVTEENKNDAPDIQPNPADPVNPAVPADPDVHGDKLWISDIRDYTYTGYPIIPEFSVYSGSQPLVAGVDYVASFKNNTKANSNVTVTIKGIGNYSGTATKSFAIKKINIDDVKLASDTFAAGNAYTPVFIYEESENIVILKENIDYSISYDSGKNPSKKAGQHSATIIPKSNGALEGGPREFNYNVDSDRTTSIAKARLTVGNMTFGGKYPYTSVKVDGKELEQDVDYIVVFSNTYKKGTGKATFIGIGDYSGIRTKKFKVQPVKLTDDDNNKIDVFVDPVSEYIKGGVRPDVTVVVNDTTLILNTDYTVKYSKNNSTTSASTVTIKGKGNYSGIITENFTITPKDLGSDDIKIYVSEAASGQKPVVTIFDVNGKKLTNLYDYKVSTEDGTVVIKKGSKKLYHVSGNQIRLPYEMAKNKDNLLKSAQLKKGYKFSYTGSGITLEEGWLTVRTGKTTLREEDYEIVDYINNVEAGTAVAVVKGTGDYGGYAFVTFRIGGKVLSFD